MAELCPLATLPRLPSRTDQLMPWHGFVFRHFMPAFSLRVKFTFWEKLAFLCYFQGHKYLLPLYSWLRSAGGSVGAGGVNTRVAAAATVGHTLLPPQLTRVVTQPLVLVPCCPYSWQRSFAKIEVS